MKPILFNTDMVCAIKNGTKTVTRRAVRPHYRAGESGFRIVTNAHTGKYVRVEIFDEYEDETRWLPEPCRPGDILYVRETWAPWSRTDGIVPEIHYKADGEILPGVKWRPSIHMPHEAARIFLRVTDVRVEQLQMITETQAKREGAIPAFEYNTPEGPVIVSDEDGYYILGFKGLWNNTIKPADRALYGWDVNPWVWVISFERISREEAEL